jgi:hypothetical protein
VAEETARLLEALGGWADGLRGQGDETASYAASSAPGDDRNGAAATDEQQAQGGRHGGAPQPARCEHCGVTSRAGEALACQLCPVCQGIALLRTVRPETVERLADLAAALSGALRDLAADRFGQSSAPPQPPPRGHRVQDIVVDDEDEPGTAPTTDRPRRTQESTAP